MTEPLPSVLEPDEPSRGVVSVGEVVVRHEEAEGAWLTPFSGAFFGVLAALATWTAARAVYRKARTAAWMARQPKGEAGAYRTMTGRAYPMPTVEEFAEAIKHDRVHGTHSTGPFSRPSRPAPTTVPSGGVKVVG